MALITCPECNNEISDKATACIKCGNPIKKMENQANSTNENQLKTKRLLIFPFALIFASFIFASLLPNDSSEARVFVSVVFILINTLILAPLFDKRKKINNVLKAYLIIIYLFPLTLGILGIIKDSQ
jgi:uncharacterized membrane protein YvbJ